MYQELSNTLFAERQLLRRLHFKLDSMRVFLACGKQDWLGELNSEIAEVQRELAAVEVVRAAQAADLARELHLDPNPSLRQIVEASHEPWSGIYAEHLEAMSEEITSIRAVQEAVDPVLQEGARMASSLARSVSGRGDTGFYSPDGTTLPAKPSVIDVEV